MRIIHDCSISCILLIGDHKYCSKITIFISNERLKTRIQPIDKYSLNTVKFHNKEGNQFVFGHKKVTRGHLRSRLKMFKYII